jgi:hypothetical protein
MIKVEVLPDRVLFHCETADEAMAIGTRFRVPTSENISNLHHCPDPQWTAAKYQSFAASLNERQKAMLRELLRKPDGVSANALRQMLGLRTNQGFGPILSWMGHNAKKLGMTLQDVLVSQRKMANDVEITSFTAVPAFIEIAGEGKELD